MTTLLEPSRPPQAGGETPARLWRPARVLLTRTAGAYVSGQTVALAVVKRLEKNGS